MLPCSQHIFLTVLHKTDEIILGSGRQINTVKLTYIQSSPYQTTEKSSS